MNFWPVCVVFLGIFALSASLPSPWALFPVDDPFDGGFDNFGSEDKSVNSGGNVFPFPADDLALEDLSINTTKYNATSILTSNISNIENATDKSTTSAIDLLLGLMDPDSDVIDKQNTRNETADSETLGSFTFTKDFTDGIGNVSKQLGTEKLPHLNQDELEITSTTASVFEKPKGVNDHDPDAPSVLDFHPRNETLASSRFIRFSTTNSLTNDWQHYVDSLDEFLRPYGKEAQLKNVHCDFERVLVDGEACRFDLVYLGPSCTKNNNFGYSIGKPCVILSPAAIPNWVPTPYANDSVGIPDEIHRLMRIFNANFMFVTCDGEDEADKKSIGPMAYLPPYQGFPSYFFPYRESANYLPPLMAIEFLNPANSTRISVVCKVWAKNLDQQLLSTTLKFSLQVN